MYLYNLSLQKASGITHAITGSFSGTKQQEIVVAKGKLLEIMRVDPASGKLYTLLSTEVFGIIRSIMPFRLTGGSKDYIVIGSDSGRIVVLEYIPSKNTFEKIQQETYGKSGCRRIIPGQYLAVDPKGRALMIGAVEKQKLVYVMNRDSQARLTISSPLEAHKSNTFVYHIVGVDVGFENPTFACIEMDYEEADQDPTGEAARSAHQLLTYYELDLGLNHVVRKYSEALEEHANFLITVPGGNEVHSGILICSENYITYKNFGDEPDIRCPIPQRRNDLDDPDRGILFVCSATHRTKKVLFFLVQTEQGDIFKINLEKDKETVTEIRLKYFDTVPVATAMCVLKTGFLFVASEFGNQGKDIDLDSTVEEVTDSGFLGTTPTLTCSQLGDDALVQIYPDGIRHIRADKRINVWRTPGKKTIQRCAVNRRQVVIALTGGELVYFEMDATGQLNEYTERKEMPADVICMALGRIPQNEQRSRFLAVGLADNTVRILSLDPSDCLTPLTMQGLPTAAESLCIVEMGASESENGGNSSGGIIYLNIGLNNGVLFRVVLDPVTGELTDTRTRYLGTSPVKLFRVSMQGGEAVLAVSSRSWLSYMYQSRFHIIPLSYEALEYASGFSSEQCPEGIVAICDNSLRILALEKLGAVFNQNSTLLQYTPRRFVFHPESNNAFIIETDHNAYTDDVKEERRKQMGEVSIFVVILPNFERLRLLASLTDVHDKEKAAGFLSRPLSEEQFGAPKAGPGMWASLLRILNPLNGETLQLCKFAQNEAAHAITMATFINRPGEYFVIVAISKDLVLNPRSCTGGILRVFRTTPTGDRLDFVHDTPVEDYPSALCAYQGRLLAGVGNRLRLYDMGKKKLLKKSENRHFPNLINGIYGIGQRIIVTDVQESLFWVRYKPRADIQLVIFADDASPRWVTQLAILDNSTAAVADKFGNVIVLRLPTDVNDNVEEDPSGTRSLWDRNALGGASQKLDMVCHFYVGEVVTRLQKATLIPGGSEALVYSTLSGSLGILIPFISKDAYSFFQHLELHMRTENISLVGRDHLHYRSLYYPCKNVIDGDLCEMYNSLEADKQRDIADEMDKTPTDIAKRLEDMRTRCAF
ncbi:unnamed protein product [Hymenolepis diminuta]|uniref:CPSF_A domain-containing protein n=1 Tax=Hymenolepis diminuta TaxID=6216 RepID=A0A0R3SSC3_HYMDI|nr:unnamed protein product [Hymenolepis diminuta]